MSVSDLARSPCSVARAITRVGDPWTLMILREMFLGSRRFDDFQRLTGISPHSLSLRLKQMTADGIIELRAYCDTPPRNEYLLTEMGRDLWPVIVTLRGWGEKWLGSAGPAIRLRHKQCGCTMDPHLVCPECHSPIQARDAAVTLAPSFRTLRQK